MKIIPRIGLFDRVTPSTGNRRSAKARHKRLFAARLCTEALEDRTLLSAGMLDATFGVGGRVTLPTTDVARTVQMQADGKIVIAGFVTQAGAGQDFAVARFNTDGSPDNTFGVGGTKTIDFGGFEAASSVAVQSDGKIVVAGSFESYPPNHDADFAVARLNSDGSLDNDFGSGGKQTIDFGGSEAASSVAVQSDGKIVVAGSSGPTGATMGVVVRLNSDGSLDNEFGTGGKHTVNFGTSMDLADFGSTVDDFSYTIRSTITGVATQPDGKIVVGGVSLVSMSYTVPGETDITSAQFAEFAAARLNSDANFDDSFGTEGKQLIDTGFASVAYAQSLVVESDGKIVLAGVSYTNSGDFAVARLNSNGSRDNSFGTGGTQTVDFTSFYNNTVISSYDNAFAIAVQPDGRIVIAGSTQDPEVGGSGDFAVARLRTDGNLDSSFGAGGKQIIDFNSSDDQGFGVALQSDGKIVVVGYSKDSGAAVARLSGIGEDISGGDVPAGVSRLGSILRFSGGAGADVITVSGGSLIVNGTPYSLAGVTEVRLWGRGGNDRIDLSGMSVRAFLDGGDGNDLLTGGGADDIIFGRAGDDTMTGAAGNDFLVGGTGKDRIVGSAGNDILVAGDVDSALDFVALQAISQEWAATHSASDAEAIDAALDETIGDMNSDQLTGGAGADLFIISLGDVITDFQFGKPKTNKDGDVVIKDGVITT